MKKLILVLFGLLLSINALADDCKVFGPVDGVELSADFYFICQWGDNSNMVLEISSDEKFENMVFVGSSRWTAVEDADGWIQFPMALNELSNGIYYWRIERNGDYSVTRSFIIAGSSSSEGYTIVRDATDYEPVKINGINEPLILSSLWIRSEVAQNGLEQSDYGAYNRGMVVKNGVIYLSYGDSKGNSHIDKYDAATGQYLGQMSVDYKSYAVPEYPFSNFEVDDVGNVYAVSCGSMYPTKRSIMIHLLDLTTDPDVASVVGAYECKVSDLTISGGTVDAELIHTDIYGDISTGEFQAYTIINNESEYSFLVEWSFTPGASTTTKVYAMQLQLGQDPNVYKLASNRYMVDDQSSIHPSVFNTSKRGTFIGEFTQASDTYTATTDYMGNGMHLFTHAGVQMLTYASQAKDGFKFDILTMPQFSESYSYVGATKLWSFPSKTLGSVLSGVRTTIATTVDATPVGALNPRTNLYIYASGNGLAAYSLFHATTTAVDDLNSESKISYQIKDNVISFSEPVEIITIYDILGNRCVSANNTDVISLSALSAGVYVVNAIVKGESVTQKIILR